MDMERITTPFDFGWSAEAVLRGSISRANGRW